jgi:hypothetical protein
MRNLLLGAVATTLLLGASFAGAATQFNDGVYRGNDRPMLEDVQLYVFGGRNFCWYDAGWEGPGYYWCGYSWRRGIGWGGGFGWNGWRGGHGGGGHASSARFVSGGHSGGGHSGGGGHASSARLVSGGGHSGGGHSGGHSSGGGHGGGGGGHGGGGGGGHHH